MTAKNVTNNLTNFWVNTLASHSKAGTLVASVSRNTLVSGKTCHPEFSARDLGKISPFGRNDNLHYLCAFARDIPILLLAASPRKVRRDGPLVARL
jgi:hypothetical protein